MFRIFNSNKQPAAIDQQKQARLADLEKSVEELLTLKIRVTVQLRAYFLDKIQKHETMPDHIVTAIKEELFALITNEIEAACDHKGLGVRPRQLEGDVKFLKANYASKDWDELVSRSQEHLEKCRKEIKAYEARTLDQYAKDEPLATEVNERVEAILDAFKDIRSIRRGFFDRVDQIKAVFRDIDEEKSLEGLQRKQAEVLSLREEAYKISGEIRAILDRGNNDLIFMSTSPLNTAMAEKGPYYILAPDGLYCVFKQDKPISKGHLVEDDPEKVKKLWLQLHGSETPPSAPLRKTLSNQEQEVITSLTGHLIVFYGFASAMNKQNGICLSQQSNNQGLIWETLVRKIKYLREDVRLDIETSVIGDGMYDRIEPLFYYNFREYDLCLLPEGARNRDIESNKIYLREKNGCIAYTMEIASNDYYPKYSVIHDVEISRDRIPPPKDFTEAELNKLKTEILRVTSAAGHTANVFARREEEILHPPKIPIHVPQTAGCTRIPLIVYQSSWHSTISDYEKELLEGLGFDLHKKTTIGNSEYFDLPDNLQCEERYHNNFRRKSYTVYLGGLPIISVNQVIDGSEHDAILSISEENIERYKAMQADRRVQPGPILTPFQYQVVSALDGLKKAVETRKYEDEREKWIKDYLAALASYAKENPYEFKKILVSKEEYQQLCVLFPDWESSSDVVRYDRKNIAYLLAEAALPQQSDPAAPAQQPIDPSQFAVSAEEYNLSFLVKTMKKQEALQQLQTRLGQFESRQEHFDSGMTQLKRLCYEYADEVYHAMRDDNPAKKKIATQKIDALKTLRTVLDQSQSIQTDKEKIEATVNDIKNTLRQDGDNLAIRFLKEVGRILKAVFTMKLISNCQASKKEYGTFQFWKPASALSSARFLNQMQKHMSEQNPLNKRSLH